MPDMTLEQANLIIAAALARARALGLPPVGCAVLDSGGHLVSFQREDGLGFVRITVCQAKAWGALGTGVGTRALAERYAAGVVQEGFINGLNAMTGGRVVPLAGGVLVRAEGGRVIGAVGVSGAHPDQDEACAVAGIEAAGHEAVPGAPPPL